MAAKFLRLSHRVQYLDAWDCVAAQVRIGENRPHVALSSSTSTFSRRSAGDTVQATRPTCRRPSRDAPTAPGECESPRLAAKINNAQVAARASRGRGSGQDTASHKSARRSRSWSTSPRCAAARSRFDGSRASGQWRSNAWRELRRPGRQHVSHVRPRRAALHCARVPALDGLCQLAAQARAVDAALAVFANLVAPACRRRIASDEADLVDPAIRKGG
jgi:hypothetical protein